MLAGVDNKVPLTHAASLTVGYCSSYLLYPQINFVSRFTTFTILSASTVFFEFFNSFIQTLNSPSQNVKMVLNALQGII